MDTHVDPQPPADPRAYEFDAGENHTIRRTARWIQVFAGFSIIGGLLVALAGFVALPAGLANIAVGAVYFVIGVWFRNAARDFMNVVETSGSDIDHLLRAVDRLGTAFKALVVLTGLAVLLMVIASVMAVVTRTLVLGG
jgi:membrane protein YqaA with SNARE-associated domain